MSSWDYRCEPSASGRKDILAWTTFYAKVKGIRRAWYVLGTSGSLVEL
jgi:hypothetical protein